MEGVSSLSQGYSRARLGRRCLAATQNNVACETMLCRPLKTQNEGQRDMHMVKQIRKTTSLNLTRRHTCGTPTSHLSTQPQSASPRPTS